MASNIDGDDYVTIGTPFDLPEEDEPLPKPSKVEDQIVTDEKGRRRFHGAFTGGFSAGYFNTVGSKEGWAPSSFKSSRSKKNEGEQVMNVASRPEDFMDDEDFAEHGIAPKKLKTTFQHSCAEDDFETQKKSLLRAINDEEVHSAIPGGGDALVNLLAPPKHSIGIQLLQKMGWKPGQGIGEKIELSPEKDVTVKKKIYGCALPPKSRVKSYDMNTFNMMLAPKDIQPITFNKKDNFHGIGYSGIITSQTKLRSTAAVDSDRSFRPTGREKKGIRGQAFGIGVFEEEDDDIYGENSLSNYDMTMVDDNDDKHGWTGSMSKPKVYKDCLPGFIKSMKKLNIQIPSVTIQTPQNIPRHVFPDDVSKEEKTQKDKTIDNNSSLKHTKLSSQERGDLLGEVTKSMQDVKHWTLKWDQGTSSKHEDVSDKKETVDKAIPVDVIKSKPSRWDKDTDPVRPRQDSKKLDDASKSYVATSNDNKGVFKPFSRYPEKQERYEVYLEAVKKGFKPDLKYDTSMTEWEKEREIAEFARAATMYKPLTSSMASRFVRANFIDSEDAARSKDKDDKPDDKKAAEMGMFGKLTRTLLEWHPDPVLCKRMNIPNPYPSSKIKGVPSRNKKQTSFFSDSLISDSKNITPNEQKSDEVEEEDEFFSRIQKNKQKLLQSKSGPLSHLNIKLDCNKTNDSYKSNLKNATSDLSTGEEKEVIVKPSIDIFKAIFENSDSENSDEDSKKEELVEKSVANKSSDSVSNANNSRVSVSNVSITHNSTCPSIINEQLSDSKSNSRNINVRNNVQLTSDKKSKFLPLSFLNPDQTKNDTSSTSDNKLEKDEESKGNNNDNDEIFYEKKSNEKSTVIHLEHKKSNEKSSNNGDNKLDSSLSNYEKSKHKKRKKEKKSKKSKKKNFSSENSDNESDSNHSKRKKKHSDGICSDDDSDKYYKKKKKKRYKSDESDNETNKRHKKKKSKRHRSSSSSSKGSVVPSNTLLLDKLKKLAQSSRRPTAADFM